MKPRKSVNGERDNWEGFKDGKRKMENGVTVP